MDLMLKLPAFTTLLAQAAATTPPGREHERRVLVVKWASPFFLLGAGILAGLVLLGLFLLLIKLLTKIAPWEKLSQSSAGHFVAAGLTAVVAAAAISLMHTYTFTTGDASVESWMIYLAVALLSAIVGWCTVFCAGARVPTHFFATLGEGASRVLGGGCPDGDGGRPAGRMRIPATRRRSQKYPQIVSNGTRATPSKSQPLPPNVELDQAELTEVPLSIEYQLMTSMVIRSTRQ